MLRYFAAVLPPADISQKIVETVQSGLDDGSISSTTPNVKVVFHEGMDPYPEWEDVVKKVAAESQPFEVRFGKPEFIGGYMLAVPMISEGIEKIHARSVEVMYQIQKDKNVPESPDEIAAFFESQSVYNPRLILSTGMFPSGFKKRRLLKKITKAFSEMPAFNVSELALYEATIYGRTYEPQGKIALGKPEAKLEPALGLQPILS